MHNHAKKPNGLASAKDADELLQAALVMASVKFGVKDATDAFLTGAGVLLRANIDAANGAAIEAFTGGFTHRDHCQSCGPGNHLKMVTKKLDSKKKAVKR